MNFLIYGAGSLGLLFARYLSKTNDVETIVRPKIKQALDRNALEFVKDGYKEKIKIESCDDLERLEKNPDIIILSVKSFDVDKSLDDISRFFENKHIITIQNGIYAEDAVKRRFGSKYSLPAYVMIGSKTKNNHTIEEFLNNGMKIGYLDKKSKGIAEEVNDVFNKSGIDCTLSDNIMKEKWHKMMFYCAGAVLNSLTGTKDLEDVDIRLLVRGLLNEIAAVCSGLSLNFAAQQLSDEVYDFLMNFKPKQWNASVGEDLKKGKKTEIDYLNGYIVKLSKELGINVPLNEAVLSLVKTIEKTGYFTSCK